MNTGVVVAERFEIERLAASGGMGAVYRARDRQTDQLVALKALHGTSREDEARFGREAQMLGELRHPGIVRYVAHGTAGSGERYIAIEWLEGETLKERLSREGLTANETLELAARTAEALGFLHGRGIVHRDVKPSNVFLVGGRVDRPKLLDFGIARPVVRARELTMTGVMVGTPGYMAPEQARGEPEVDARADVFALGCVLFSCLTGRAPFGGDDVLAVLLRIVLEDPPRVREIRADVPDALDDLVARMLSKPPAERPADGRAVAEEIAALGRVSGGRAAAARDSLPGLTVTEQRVMSLVLANTPARRAGEETDASEELARRESAVHEVARAFGGTSERIADGSLVVSFAGAGAATDQAARAARCALAIRPLLAGVPVVVVSGRGVIASRLPLGDVIDRGVRLLSHGGGVGIPIDELTAGLLDASFEVRGDEARLYLVSSREPGEVDRTLLGKLTPCVGRDREIARLLSVFEECASEPVARAVLVTAPAGFGKSRLRYELLRAISARAGWAAQVWMGRGDPMSAGSPFCMLAPALRRAAGILDGEPIVVRRNKLAARVARSVVHDQRRVTEFLGELVGVPFPDEDSVQLRAARKDAMLMGDQMRRALSDFVVAECSAGPLLVVLEDLHWGDLPSVKLVEAALRAAHDRPLLVFALARPEIHGLFPRLWADQGMTEMNLPALTRKAADRLVREVLGDGVHPDTLAVMIERAGGNAFYLEELIRAVAEGKGDALPETVLAMVQARLDGLEIEARRVLRAASVFGQAFWRGGLESLLGGAKRAVDLDAWLSILVERELITRRPVARFPGEEEYGFRHALVREAAYAMLTEADRALGHRLAAQWLEGAGEADAMTMAEHLERAQAPGSAVRWYHSAAVQALEGNDFELAVARAERAVACGAADDVRGALRLLQAEANRWRGEHVAAGAAAREAMTLLPEGEPAWYAAAGEAVLAAGRLGAYDELTELTERMGRADRGGEMSGPELAATARAGFYLLVAGRHELAAPLIARVERTQGPIAQRDPSAAARMHQARAVKALFAADPALYLQAWEASVECFERAGDFRSACPQRGNVAFAYIAIGMPERAEKLLRASLAEAESMGLHTVAALARANLGLALGALGRHDGAAAVLEAAIETLGPQGDPRLLAGTHSYLARVHLERGQHERAERDARRAVEVLESTPPARAFALATLALVLLARGMTQEAVMVAEQAHDLLERLGGIEEGEALVRLLRAETLFAVGRTDEGRRAIATAADRLHTLADKISDPALRTSFLENVADNVRTLALARSMLTEA